MKPKDRVLQVGRRLEKKGLASFKMTTPSGHPAYYRAQGLQIIPSEAEEIDTNMRCQIVITKEAAALSGLIMTVLKILGQGEGGMGRASAAVAQFKALLAEKKLGEWEHGAAKDIVSASLSLADKTFPTPNHSDGWDDVEDFGDHIMRQYIHRRKIRNRQHDSFDHEHIGAFSEPLNGSNVTEPIKTSGDWLTIRGIIGLKLNQQWIPVSFPSVAITHKEELSILRAITHRGLRPEIAMTIIANRAKDLKRRA
jgi:hypothetical protein